MKPSFSLIQLLDFGQTILIDQTKAVQIQMSQNVNKDPALRRTMASRLAVMQQALEDLGFSEDRIVPVLTETPDEDTVVLKIAPMKTAGTLLE